MLDVPIRENKRHRRMRADDNAVRDSTAQSVHAKEHEIRRNRGREGPTDGWCGGM